MRADKLTLAALSATLLLHRDPAHATDAIPVLRMLTLPARAARGAGRGIAGLAAGSGTRRRGPDARGGGRRAAFPGTELESRAVAVEPETMRPAALAAALRRRSVPIVGTVQRDRLLLDVRNAARGRRRPHRPGPDRRAGMSATARGAVFLDRDGTIIDDPGYLHDPDLVALLPGAAEGLARLARQGWPLVIVSNQSGIARGLYKADAFERTMRRLEELLAPSGVRFLGTWYCPHHPDVTGPCDCRKPATRLFRDAAAAHGLELGASWFVGDRWRDVAPALELGGRGILVGPAPHEPDAAEVARTNMKTAPDLAAAAFIIGDAMGAAPG